MPDWDDLNRLKISEDYGGIRLEYLSYHFDARLVGLGWLIIYLVKTILR